MKYRIVGLPVFVGGHLFNAPTDIGRTIVGADGLEGSKLVAVGDDAPAPPPTAPPLPAPAVPDGHEPPPPATIHEGAAEPPPRRGRGRTA